MTTNEIEAALDVADVAAELVALWENQNIRGLPRAERNAAIDGTREKLIKAVHEWKAADAAERSAEQRDANGTNKRQGRLAT